MPETPTTRSKKLVRSVHPMKHGRGLPFAFALIAIVMLGATALWAYVAQTNVATVMAVENEPYVARAHKLLDVLRSRTQESLRAQCRVLADDPRLKSTLATEGIDAATVTDILNDLARLRHTGLLVVLSPDGHVFAESNADELRGLDLSTSSVIKKALTSDDAVIGSWVIGGKLIDLSTMAIRFNSTVIGFLVVGQALDQELLEQVAETAGVSLAVVLGTQIAIAVPDNESTRTMLLAISKDASGAKPRIMESGGERFLTATVDLDDAGQAHPRVALARGLTATAQNFQTLRWLLWAAPVLVVLAILFSFLRPSPMRSTTRPGEAE